MEQGEGALGAFIPTRKLRLSHTGTVRRDLLSSRCSDSIPSLFLRRTGRCNPWRSSRPGKSQPLAFPFCRLCVCVNCSDVSSRRRLSGNSASDWWIFVVASEAKPAAPRHAGTTTILCSRPVSGWLRITDPWVAYGLARLGSARYGPRFAPEDIAMQDTAGCGTVSQGHIAVVVSVRVAADSRDV